MDAYKKGNWIDPDFALVMDDHQLTPPPQTPFLTISSTPYGGRGAFARSFLREGTTILTCSGPYASVIIRKFRKEVCAHCFAYAHEHRKSKWHLKALLASHQSDPQKPGGGKQTSSPETGVWFCSEDCLDRWVEIYQLRDGEGARWVLELLSVFEKAAVESGNRKDVSTSNRLESPDRDSLQSRLTLLEANLQNDAETLEITKEFIYQTWQLVELHEEKQSKNGKGGQERRPCLDEPLGEFELDTARFVLDGLIRNTIEIIGQKDSSKLNPLSLPAPNDRTSPNAEMGVSQSTGTWTDFLELQNNELSYIRSKPYMLVAHVRAYLFLKHLVHAQLPTHLRQRSRMRDQRRPQAESDGGQESVGSVQDSENAVRMLQALLDTPLETRALLGRDPGNVFGIWEIGNQAKAKPGAEDEIMRDADSELLGWGAYVFGSYFNHDCSPNVKKMPVKGGRGVEFYTLRDIHAGEELCIAYVDVDERQTVQARNKQLQEWFFQCKCRRCLTESGQPP